MVGVVLHEGYPNLPRLFHKENEAPSFDFGVAWVLVDGVAFPDLVHREDKVNVCRGESCF